MSRLLTRVELEWHEDDALWIATDPTRQGCWASGFRVADAVQALTVAADAYDTTFPSADGVSS